MIELVNVSKYYNNNGVVALGLRNVNLKLSKGEIVAIVGESGSGKSTLLNVICGVDTYEEGEILFKGNETSYFNQDDMDNYRKKNVSFIYQSYNIIDSYTVLQNVMLPLIINGSDYKKAKEKALELIDKVGLSHRVKHRGIKLSGGEKQRCVIARALASDCEILACDEPTGNLDSKTGEEIINLIKEVAKDKLVLIVTHNYEQVSNIVTRTIRVSDGEIVEDVVKENIDVDTKEEIDFSNSKLKQKKLMWISLRNILSTPKKNILTLAVFVVLSMVGFFLFLSCLKSSEESQYNPYDDFTNIIENRLIVFDKDGNTLDIDKLSKIKGEIYTNAFYEDEMLQMTLLTSKYDFSGTVSAYLPEDITIISGSKPVKDDDVFIVIPESDTDSIIDIKNNLNNSAAITGINKNLNVCGLATSNKIKYPLFVVDEKNLDNLKKVDIFSISKVLVDDKEIEFSIGGSGKRRVIYCSPEKKDIETIEVFIKGIYSYEIKDYTLEWQYSNEECIYIGLDDINLDTYEATIYADNVKAAIRVIENAGYSYFQPAKSGYNKLSINYILFVLYTVLSCLAMLVLTFVAYIVLARIYSSKNKDYTILRSLGLVKKQLAKIVDYEVLFVGFLGSLVALSIYYIISIFDYDFKYMMSFNSLWFTILYFMLILMFSYIISRRFNKRLFKFSISTSIKDEVE